MLHKRIWLRLSLLLTISPLIAACVFSYPERHTRDYSVRLLRPYPGQIFPLSEITLLGVAFHYESEVVGMEFFANGRSIGEFPAPAARDSDLYAYGEIQWTPPEVGEYMLQVQADILDGPDVMSQPVRICVIEFEIDGGSFGEISGYEGPCDVPRSVRAPGTGRITLTTRAEPDSIIYNEYYETLPCPEVADPSLTFVATVDDPPDAVLFVVVYYSMPRRPSSISAGETRTHVLVLTNTRFREPSTVIYVGQTEPLSMLLGNYFGGDGGTITWSARAIGRDGRIILEDGPYTIEAAPACERIVPLILPIPATATATLVPSEENCPPGTYYAPVTNQCIAIEIQTPKPGGDGTGCASHGSKDSCTAAGCNWDPDKNTCS